MAILGVLCSQNINAKVLRIAVASNFIKPLTEIAQRYEQTTGTQVKLSAASTGKHYVQIRNGAPFDIFFAADAHRPQLLEHENYTIKHTRDAYAFGTLALWCRRGCDETVATSLAQKNIKRIALANPKLAPYGQAAKEVLTKLNLWDTLQDKYIYGENIAQTYQFIATGHAGFGFIARSQLPPNTHNHANYLLIDTGLHQPIIQQSVILKSSRHPDEATAFMSFYHSPPQQSLISQYGYDLQQQKPM